MSPPVSERVAVAWLLDQGHVPRGGNLVVHAAFRSLAGVGFRAEAFIEALLERMAGGTLIMPAMSWRTVTPQQPVWDEQTTAGHVGILAEIFRTRYSEHRSIHPTHSACGTGSLAACLLRGHEIDDTPCSSNSPWGKLAAANAHILLLGIGFERCTALHHPEEVVSPNLYLVPIDQAETYTCLTRAGKQHTVRLRRHRRDERNFPQYTNRLSELKKLARGDIYGTPWQLVGARDLLENALANLRERPDAHLRMEAN
jgi:aminoglycoside 3-N-acetyltransferase